MRKLRVSAEVWLVLVTLVWSGTFVLVKGVVQIIPPFTFNTLRFGLSFAVVLLIVGNRLRLLTRRELLQGMWIGVLYGFGFFLQTIGLQYTTVGRSSFITGSVVVIVPFAYWLVERRKATTAQKIGVVVAAIGLWLFTNPSGGPPNLGDILTFVSALGWAFYICYLDIFTRTAPADGAFGLTARLVIVQFGVAFAIGLFGMVALENAVVPVTTQTVVAVLYTSLLATVVATLLQTHYQSRVGPVKAALIFTLEPVFATLIAVVAIDEPFGVWEIAGGALVVAGVLTGEISDALVQARRKATYDRS